MLSHGCAPPQPSCLELGPLAQQKHPPRMFLFPHPFPQACSYHPLSVSVDRPPQGPHVTGIIQDLSFCDSFSSLSPVSSRPCAVAGVSPSLLCVAGRCPTPHRYHILFIGSWPGSICPLEQNCCERGGSAPGPCSVPLGRRRGAGSCGRSASHLLRKGQTVSRSGGTILLPHRKHISPCLARTSYFLCSGL